MNKLDKVIQHFRNLRESGVPTMNTGTSNGSPGFGSYADSRGPVAGITFGLGKYDGRSRIMRRLPYAYRQLFNKKKVKNK